MADLSIISKEGSSCTELIQCFFGLNSSECQAFYFIAAQGSVTLDELAQHMRRDRSTTHRLLQKLVNLGLCYKEKDIIPRGGYIHRYTSVSVPRLQKSLEGKIEDHVKDLENLVSCLGEDLEKKISDVSDMKE